MSSAEPGITIERYDRSASLKELEPLWTALREHHGEVAPQHGPTRERWDSWELRHSTYTGWLNDKPGSFLLIARDGDAAVGYAMVTTGGPLATWPGDGDGCLQTLSVHPAVRGRGVGSLLITAARAGLAEQGIAKMTIDVVAQNEDALRFYRRHGFGDFVVSLRGATAP